MKFNKKNTALLLATTLLTSSFSSVAYASSIPKTRTIKIKGIESLISSDLPSDAFTIVRGSKSFSGKNGFSLTAGDIIETGTGVTAHLEIDNNIIIEMFQNTKLEVEKTKSNDLEISIVEGDIFFDTNGSLKADEQFQFSAGGMIMGVRGTSGVIAVSENNEAEASLYTGLVEIIDEDDDSENPEVLMSLTPGNRIEHDGDFFVTDPYPNSLDEMSGYEVLVLSKLLSEHAEFSDFRASTIEKTSLIRDVVNSIFENSDLPVIEFSTIDPTKPNTIIQPSVPLFNIEVVNIETSNDSSNSNYSDNSSNLTPFEEILANLTVKTEEVKLEVVVQKEEEEDAKQATVNNSSSETSSSSSEDTPSPTPSVTASATPSPSPNDDDSFVTPSPSEDPSPSPSEDPSPSPSEDPSPSPSEDPSPSPSDDPSSSIETVPTMPTSTSANTTTNKDSIDSILSSENVCIFDGGTIDGGITITDGETLFINGDTTLTNTLSIEDGGTLVVNSGKTLSGGAGKIQLEDNSSLYNTGTISTTVEVETVKTAKLIQNTGEINELKVSGTLAQLTNSGTIAQLTNLGTITNFKSVSINSSLAKVTAMSGSPAETSSAIGTGVTGVLQHTLPQDATTAQFKKILDNGGTTPYLTTNLILLSAITTNDTFEIGSDATGTREITLSDNSITFSGTITIDNASILKIDSNATLTSSGYIYLNNDSKLNIVDQSKFTFSPSTIIPESNIIYGQTSPSSVSFVHYTASNNNFDENNSDENLEDDFDENDLDETLEDDFDENDDVLDENLEDTSDDVSDENLEDTSDNNSDETLEDDFDENDLDETLEDTSDENDVSDENESNDVVFDKKDEVADKKDEATDENDDNSDENSDEE